MILKIERYTFDKSTRNWYMLDDIRKVSRTLIKKVPFINEDPFPEIMIFDFEQYVKDNPEKYADNAGKLPSKRDVIKLICRLSNGEEFSVIFDTLAYICNDEGKTIEKIVANYND